jgi:hypothetical protein
VPVSVKSVAPLTVAFGDGLAHASVTGPEVSNFAPLASWWLF